MHQHHQRRMVHWRFMRELVIVLQRTDHRREPGTSSTLKVQYVDFAVGNVSG